MKILITGDKSFHGASAVYGALDRAHAKRKLDTIILHAEGGPEYLAKDWARDNGVRVHIYNDKPRALREQRMIEEGQPDGAICFGQSSMQPALERAGIRVWVIKTGPDCS